VRVFQTLLAFSGNAPPQLALTRKLVERGHEVRVLAHRAARARVVGTGAEFVQFRRAQPNMDMALREHDSLRDWEARTRIGAALRVRDNLLVGLLLDTARECAELLKSHAADVVVLDWMLPGAAVAAEGAGMPAVALVHCPLPLPIDGAPPLGSGLRPMGGRLGVVRDRLLGRAVSRLFAPGLPVLNQARAEQGLEPLDEWYAQLLGVDAIYVMTARELDFSSRGTLPANVSYVGHAFEAYAEKEWRSPWPDANRDPLVVVSFSTSYMNQLRSVQRVLDALAGLPVRVLLTAGPALDAEHLRIPANTRAVAFVPHRMVSPHAALVVTHAGWQTVNAALADGVPLVCIPGGRDQPDNAVRVVLAGAGVRVRNNASTRTLRAVIAAAIEDPTLLSGARAMATALGRKDGAVAIADQLEQLAARNGVAAP
jgi:UDP:flavonoid glycosyltransferase YjiC (YdhE family)